MQYVEMTAHNCKSVHAPGVAWPKYVAPEKRGRSRLHIKTEILDLLKYGAALTAEEIRDEICGPLATVQTNLYLLLASGYLSATKRKLTKRKPINVYSIVAQTQH